MQVCRNLLEREEVSSIQMDETARQRATPAGTPRGTPLLNSSCISAPKKAASKRSLHELQKKLSTQQDGSEDAKTVFMELEREKSRRKKLEKLCESLKEQLTYEEDLRFEKIKCPEECNSENCEETKNLFLNLYGKRNPSERVKTCRRRSRVTPPEEEDDETVQGVGVYFDQIYRELEQLTGKLGNLEQNVFERERRAEKERLEREIADCQKEIERFENENARLKNLSHNCLAAKSEKVNYGHWLVTFSIGLMMGLLFIRTMC